MIDRLVVSAASLNNLLAIKDAQRQIDLTTLRLSTGRKVNSALDNPQNFFTARALDNRASDIARLLDGIGSAIRTIEEASTGVTAIGKLLDLAEADAQTALEHLTNAPAAVGPTVPPLNTQILAANPVAYWRLEDTAGATATNLGSIGAATNATYQNAPTLGAAALYDGGPLSVQLNGTDESVIIPNHPSLNTSAQPRRSVELVFNANTTVGRQVLYEEGGTSNAFSIYILNGSLYINGRDAGAWGPANISIPINAGQTYHVGLTFDFPNAIFRGYVNGVEIGNTAVNATFPSHSGNIGIGRMDNGTWFHDGSQGGNNYYFNGRVGDVAIYNSVLNATQMQDHAAAVVGGAPPTSTRPEFESIMTQIDQLVRDAQYRGINLLKSDMLFIYFNENRTNKLETEGVDFTSRGLGIKRSGFDTEEGITLILASIRAAREEVRGYGNTLATNLNIIKIRQIFTRETINVLEAGAAELVDADPNEEGANLLAARTRQELAVTSLSVATSVSNNVLNLFA